MTAAERLIHEAHLRFQKAKLKPNYVGSMLPPMEIKKVSFAEPRSEQWIAQHRAYRPAGFYQIHCAHDRLLWHPCTMCHRAKREADLNFVKMLEKQALKATAKL
jgi:hypothetical protein